MEKRIMLFFFLLSIGTYAQTAKQYEVKSGKIVYRHLKYKQTTKTVTDSEGNKTYERKDVPYVSKEVNYYWNDYGAIWFEEAFKVSEFGGKPLPKKVKMYESLHKNGHRYFYSFEEYKFADDFIGDRGKWRKKPEQVKKEGWYKVAYPKAKVTGVEKVCGKKATIYDQSYWLWKGVILKQVSYTTTRKGKIIGIDRSKEATMIKKLKRRDREKFNPMWLQKELVYKKLNYQSIDSLITNKQYSILDKNTKITQGDKFIYKTNKGDLGKIVITEIDEKDEDLKFIYMTYNAASGVSATGHNYGRPVSIKNNEFMDLDRTVDYKAVGGEDPNDNEIKIDFTHPSKITPFNDTIIYQF